MHGNKHAFSMHFARGDYFFMSGQVKNPGRYFFDFKTRLGVKEALEFAGGIVRSNAGTAVYLQRKAEKLARMVSDGTLDANGGGVEVRRGDHICVTARSLWGEFETNDCQVPVDRR
jgi:protein involved in polysaccharide export with SLBB domain